EPGSVLIRDPGMLHRGTPNQTETPRTMLTICYLRRTHRHDYGDIGFNLDESLLETLAPAAKRLFIGTRPEQMASATPASPPRTKRKWRWFPWHQRHARPVSK